MSPARRATLEAARRSDTYRSARLAGATLAEAASHAGVSTVTGYAYERAWRAGQGYPATPVAGPECRLHGCATAATIPGLTVCWRHLHEDLGITYRQLDHWVRRGYLQPRQDQSGPGNARVWSEHEVTVAKRIALLVRAGLPHAKAAWMARDSWPRGEIAPGVWVEVSQDA